MRGLASAALTAGLIWATGAAAQARPACAEEARGQALKLLRFHADTPDGSVDGGVRKIGTVRSLKGKSTFDVLELSGAVYKAEYRLRLIYFVDGGGCTLMGQEVLERSDPG